MPINTEQFRNPALSEQERRAKINANMKQLDYSSGNGLLKAEKKTLSPSESYLFIGVGGTGQKALRSIKETINKTIKPNCHEQQVRYLVVDCAENELLKLVEDGVFEQSEIMLIPYQGAHDTISPQHIAPDKKEWVDPDLYSATGGGIPGMHPGFESDGAGAWRQPGRVRLTSPGGIEVINKIQQVINGTQHPAGNKTESFLPLQRCGRNGQRNDR